jgi:hypothetical protein
VAATIVLDQQVRNGRYDTMSDVDARDASKRCLIAIKVTYDGITWVDNPAWSTEWTGGGTNKSGGPNPPGLGISAEPDAQGRPPARAMITIDTEGFSLNMGVTLKFE